MLFAGRTKSNTTEVLYITMALIGLLAVCVFVIAGLVLVVAKRRREAGASHVYCLLLPASCAQRAVLVILFRFLSLAIFRFSLLTKSTTEVCFDDKYCQL